MVWFPRVHPTLEDRTQSVLGGGGGEDRCPRALNETTSVATGVQLPGKTLTPAHFQLLRQQQQPPPPPPSQAQVPQLQGQAQSPAQIKAVSKLTPVSAP